MVKKIKKIRSVALYASKNNTRVSQILGQLIEIIESLDLKIINPKSSKVKITSMTREVSDAYAIKNSDLMIAVGGDGTLLSCSRKFGIHGLPILGINLGNLGFLNDIAPKQITNSLIDILAGHFTVDKRFFLETEINEKVQNNIALNEVVIHSGSIAQLIDYELFIDNKFVYRQKADGLIVSTSTGSTAYALSGNGPIIHPEVNAICLLPMFPHSLNTRPMIVTEDSTILVIPNKKSFISYDSHIMTTIKKGEEVYIKKTKQKLHLVHPLDHDFFSACRTKLGWSLGVPNKNITES
mgnify:FL=1